MLLLSFLVNLNKLAQSASDRVRMKKNTLFSYFSPVKKGSSDTEEVESSPNDVAHTPSKGKDSISVHSPRNANSAKPSTPISSKYFSASAPAASPQPNASPLAKLSRSLSGSKLGTFTLISIHTSSHIPTHFFSIDPFINNTAKKQVQNYFFII